MNNQSPKNKTYRMYFAYGSNMDQEQMAYRCPEAKIIGTGILSNYRFIINIRGVASIIEEPRHAVFGILYSISISDEKALDGYEGIASGFYYKTMVRIVTQNEKDLDVMSYVASDNTIGAPRNGYVEKIIRAARQHNLPNNYLRELSGWLKIKD